MFFDPFEEWNDLVPEPPMPPVPVDVSFFEPLEMHVPITMLQAITQENLNNINGYLTMLPDLPADLRENMLRVKLQRERFLTWLSKVPEPYTYMAMYPTSENMREEMPE